MIAYLLKSSACLVIFMLFYKGFMEKESFHEFKRFYLLGVLVLSFLIPLITFTYYVGPFNSTDSYSIADQLTAFAQPSAGLNATATHLSLALGLVYSLGVLLFAFKFIINLYNIFKKIKQSPKQKSQNIVYVLLSHSVVPHTFFKYIFLNKQQFEMQAIPKEIYLHEQAHARQNHSLDVLLVELLQIVFWFHPLIYFIKKDIKLNHEFLADQAVINKGFNTKHYQKILLGYSYKNNNTQLASSINYSSIKKRFTVMKTHTSKLNMWAKSLVLLPLLAILVYSFSEKKEVVKTKTPQITQEKANHTQNNVGLREASLEQEGATKPQVDEYNKLAKHYNEKASDDKGYLVMNHNDFLKLEKLYGLMSEQQKQSVEPFPDLSKLPPPPPRAKGNGNYHFTFYLGEENNTIRFNIFGSKKTIEQGQAEKSNLKSQIQNLINGRKIKPKQITATINAPKSLTTEADISYVKNILRNLEITKVNVVDKAPPPPPFQPK